MPCYNILLCADTCWPACCTCTSLGQAALAGRMSVCDCMHSTVTTCLAVTSEHKLYTCQHLMCNDGS